MKNKIGLGLMTTANVDFIKQLEIFKETGFDAFFSQFNIGNTEQLRKAADDLGLIYQSIHASFTKMYFMWENSDEMKEAKQELFDCIDECEQYNVPIMVVHPFIGFGIDEPNEIGVENFREVVVYAKEKGIKIAFENVEGEGYLEILMNAFKNFENVGFCWDTGHEECYNRGKDMLALYGDRLIATHINDNVGVTGDDISWFDDLHLVPFDGTKDWPNAMKRLKKYDYSGIMTFELKMTKEIDDKYGTDYTSMEFLDYVKKVYAISQKLLLE